MEFLQPQRDQLFLDVGCGTGNYTIALAEKGLIFSGLDPSEKMLGEAKSKAEKINWLLGNAEQIPVAHETFDGVIATLTIHHWDDLQKAFQEICRVLKHGGRMVIFSSTKEQMEQYWLHYYFPGMLRRSTNKMPSFNKIMEAISTSGLHLIMKENYYVHDSLEDLFLFSGKNRPEIYFDDKIRGGMSSFQTLITDDELRNGLTCLRDDIDSGRLNEVRSKFKNDNGDYIFIVAEKKNL